MSDMKMHCLYWISTLFILCLAVSTADDRQLTMDFVFDLLSRRLDNLAFEIHVLQKESEKRFKDLESKLEETTLKQQSVPTVNWASYKGQIQSRINKEMRKQVVVIHRMLSAEKMIMHSTREQCFDKLKDFDIIEDRLNSFNKSNDELRTYFEDFGEDVKNQVVGFKKKLEKYGFKGQKGAPGETGGKRLKGPPGNPGRDGLPGLPGSKGIKGDQGLPGRDGPPGAIGPRGLPGLKGGRGFVGAPGPPGLKGESGFVGMKGSRGQRGRAGLPGTPGIPGEKGEKGDHGSLRTNGRTFVRSRYRYELPPDLMKAYREAMGPVS